MGIPSSQLGPQSQCSAVVGMMATCLQGRRRDPPFPCLVTFTNPPLTYAANSSQSTPGTSQRCFVLLCRSLSRASTFNLEAPDKTFVGQLDAADSPFILESYINLFAVQCQLSFYKCLVSLPATVIYIPEEQGDLIVCALLNHSRHPCPPNAYTR